MNNSSRLTVLTAAAGIMLASTVTAACGSDATIAPTGAPAPAAAQNLPELGSMSTMERIVADLDRNAQNRTTTTLGGKSTMDRIVADLNRNSSSMSTMDRIVADLED